VRLGKKKVRRMGRTHVRGQVTDESTGLTNCRSIGGNRIFMGPVEDEGRWMEVRGGKGDGKEPRKWTTQHLVASKKGYRGLIEGIGGGVSVPVCRKVVEKGRMNGAGAGGACPLGGKSCMTKRCRASGDDQ